MQLTTHTDFALRTLVALGSVAPNKLTAVEISEAYGISLNHLLKVIQKLAALGYVETSRGKSGGVKLQKDPKTIRIGDVVQHLEPHLGLVACLRPNEQACVIEPACRLKSMLRSGTQRFVATLNEYTLADALKPKAKLDQLLQLRTP